jgi:hypothetical protein
MIFGRKIREGLPDIGIRANFGGEFWDGLPEKETGIQGCHEYKDQTSPMAARTYHPRSIVDSGYTTPVERSQTSFGAVT